MLRELLRAKIHGARVTRTLLEYEGSITLDPDLLENTGMLPNEKVDIVNLNNGARFQTFVIKARKNTGEICLNGPAARLGEPGDRIHILSYVLADEKDLESFETYFVHLGDDNKILSRKVQRLKKP